MLGTDEHLTGFGTGSPQFATYTIQTGDGNVQSIWDWSYRSINSCNGVLENLPTVNIPAADKTRLSGEAKFLRGYFYFMLVTTFGDVSLSTTFANRPNYRAKRDPIAAVYDQIVKDLTEAIAELPFKQVLQPVPGVQQKEWQNIFLLKFY